MLKFLKNSLYKGIKVRIEEQLTLQCSLSKDELKVNVIISYTCRKKQIELVSLRKYLSSFKSETIESLCFKIFHEIKQKVKKLSVTIIGETNNHPRCQVQLN